MEHGVAFTVSSDAHFPDDLGKYTFANTVLLKAMAFKQLLDLTNAKTIYRTIINVAVDGYLR